MNHTGMLPLKGVRVLDLSRVLAGPLCAQTLGSLGADVIKVEPCGVGDETREWSPYRQGTGTAYLAVNLNKKGMALNLKTPEGLKIVHELVRMSDVVIESNSTGVSERLGIDYGSLRKIKADIVYCSISGFGQTGPLKDAKGYDLMLQAFSGIMAMTGNPDGGPIRIPFSPIDQVTSLNAVIGVLSALMRRGQTGEGARVEVSLFDTSVSLVGYLLQAYWQNGELPKRIGCEHPSLAPYQAFDAADKPILVGIANDALWQRFCSAFGIAHAASDERFRTNRQRVLHRAETVKLVQDIVKQHRAADLLERLIAIGVPCAPINTLGDLADHEHTAARRMTFSYEHSSLGTIQAVAQPISYDGQRQTAVNPPPALGEHTEEILRMLGYEHSEIAELVSRGAVACA